MQNIQAFDAYFSEEIGLTRTYYPGNIPNLLRLLTPTLNGLNHGTQYEFYQDGIINIVRQWVNGVEHGRRDTYYHPGNVLQSTVMFIDGLRQGAERFYHENGDHYRTQYFEMGQLAQLTHGYFVNNFDPNQAIQQFTYEAQVPIASNECSICFNEFVNPVALACHPSHIFCVNCLQQHFEANKRAQCPLCRANFQ